MSGLEKRERQRKQLPKREIDIGKRLREARLYLHLSQGEFAAKIGITRERLASYEDARAPLKWEIALKLCRYFVINELWLARGIHVSRTKVIGFDSPSARANMALVRESITDKIPPGIPFSNAFDDYLFDRFEELQRLTPFGVPRLSDFDDEDADILKRILEVTIDSFAGRLMHREQLRFCTNLLQAAIISRDELSPYNDADSLPERTPFEVDLDRHFTEAFKRMQGLSPNDPVT